MDQTNSQRKPAASAMLEVSVATSRAKQRAGQVEFRGMTLAFTQEHSLDFQSRRSEQKGALLFGLEREGIGYQNIHTIASEEQRVLASCGHSWRCNY
jgi:tRNA C32,U32 (ribose-2'-O)-methylase TrmJ